MMQIPSGIAGFNLYIQISHRGNVVMSGYVSPLQESITLECNWFDFDQNLCNESYSSIAMKRMCSCTLNYTFPLDHRCAVKYVHTRLTS